MKPFFSMLLISFLIVGCTKEETPDQIVDEEVADEVDDQAEEETVNLPPKNFEIEIVNVSSEGATINWDAAIDPENDAVTYDIYMNQELVIENHSDLTYNVKDLEELTDYSGKVIAKDTENNQTEVPFSFQTEKYYLKFLKRLDYGEYSYGPNGRGYGSPSCIIKTQDNNYVIAGGSVFLDGSGYRLFVSKIDYEGNELWKKFYDYRLTDGWNPKIINTSTGFILVSHHHVLNLDNEGNLIWYTKIDSYDIPDGSSDIKSVALDANENIFIVGGRGSSEQDIKQQAVLTKLNSSGIIEWEKVYEPSRRNFFHDIIITNENKLLVLGSTETNGATDNIEEQIDFWVLSLTNDGETLWESTYGDGRYDFPRKIIPLSNGNYAFAGFSWGAYDISEGRLFEISPDGAEIWNASNELSSTYSIAETIDGGFIATGHVDFGSYGALGIYKFSSTGVEEWNKKHQESFTYVWGYSVLVEEDGGFRVVGSLNKNYYYNEEKPELLVFKTDPEGNYY